MSTRHLPLFLALVSTGVCLLPHQARACSPPFCLPATLLPAAGPVPPAFASPALSGGHNASGRLIVRDASWPNAVLLDASPPSAGALTFERTLASGSSYQVELDTGCEQPASSRTWTVEPPSVVPSSLPALRLVGRGSTMQTMAVSTGECSRALPVGYVSMQVDLSALSPGYRNILRDMLLVVDGTPRPAAPPVWDPYARPSEPAAATDAARVLLLTTMCRDAWDLAPGKHSVSVRATVPSAVPYSIETPAIEVDLPCPDLTDGDAGTTVQADAGVANDAGPGASQGVVRADAGETTAEHDGVSSHDASQGAEDDPATPPETPADGCNAGPGKRSNAGSLLLFAALGLFFARFGRARGRRRVPASR